MSIDYADYVDTSEFRKHFKQIVKLLEENGLVKDADEFDYYAEKIFANADNQTAARVTDDYSPYRYGDALQRLCDSMPVLENPFKEKTTRAND